MAAYKLAIADDESFIRESLQKFIHWEELGFEIVLLAEDGVQIINALKSQKIDAVFCDIQMQDKTGLEVARFVSENNLDCVVVLLSGYQEFEFARQALSYGVEDYLLKPINLSDIRKTFIRVRETLDKRREQKVQKTSMESGAKIYRRTMIERFWEWGYLGLLQNDEDCRGFLRQHNLDESILDNRVCVLRIILSGFPEYNLQVQEIFSNILQMLASECHFEEVFIMCGKSDDELEVMLFEEKVHEAENRAAYINAVQTATMEICQSKVTPQVIYEGGTLAQYIKYLYNAQNKRGSAQKESPDINYIKVLARQYILILNMCEDYSQVQEKIEAILDNYGNSINITRLIHYMREMLENQLESKLPDKIWAPFDMENASELERIRDVLQNLHQYLHERHSDFITVSESVKKLVKAHIDEEISLTMASEHVFLSPNYLCRLFKEQTGEKFSEYCIRVKMERAAELLMDPRMKIYEISEQVGYKNIKYFYKLFKRVYSCTPTEYRDQAHGTMENKYKGGIN